MAETINEPGLAGLPACPLMHGTGQFSAFIALSSGGSITTLVNRNLDVEEMLDTIEQKKIQSLMIVGDAFGKPILKALDENPGRWDLSSLFIIASSGVMWSESVKQGLLKHNPTMMLFDAFSSSEAIGLGQSVSTAGAEAQTAKFAARRQRPGDHRRRTHASSPARARPDALPSAATRPSATTRIPRSRRPPSSPSTARRIRFPATTRPVEADGSLTLLGRGSVCINTGGEKVYPEEVEEVLKQHPSVLDAVAVGLPDDKFGEAITAVVQPKDAESVDRRSRR